MRYLLCACLVVAASLPAQVDPHGHQHTPPPVAAPPALKPGEKAGKISCPEMTWKFGSIPQFTTIKHDFVIRNVGEGELVITGVHPSCQCTATLPKKTRLAAGEETAIETKLDTQAFQGPLTKTITVMSNDPTTPSLILTVTGDIVPPYAIKPRQLDLGKVNKLEGGKPIELTFTITKGIETEIKDIKSSNPMLEIKPAGKLEAQPDGSRTLKLLVRLLPGTPVGLVRESITIVTTMPNAPPAAVPVTATVEGEVSVSPKTFNLGKVKHGDEVFKELDVVKAGTGDLKIEGTDVSGAFKAEVITVEAGRKYKVRVSVNRDAPPGYQKGTLTLRTNCPGETTLQAYFYAYVEKAAGN